MSLDDWKWDKGWRGTAWELGRLAWRLVAFGIALVVIGLACWFWISVLRGGVLVSGPREPVGVAESTAPT